MLGAMIAAGLLAIAFVAGVLHAKNRIMHNMMADLVEVEDIHRWLRVFS